ncbi:MAG TPA: methyltransferase domain-containing protein [Candidatus Saccharimonadales bacterium]|nr:methyltransferase domain-containing protein [Candidatus Saccharimonadales bacterium]
MEYPLKVGNELTFDGAPLTVFEPDPLVREAAELLTSRSLVMDVGVGRFQNSLFLAAQGHAVHGIEKDFGLANDAARLRRFIGGEALRCHVEFGDVTELPLNSGMYDAVVATRLLHEVTPEASQHIMDTMRRVTKPGGLNIIRAYVLPEKQHIALPHLNLFEPEELKQAYEQAGWLIEKYEAEEGELEYVKGGPRCSSTDQLVARKPFAETPRR